jgi:hypothetical protein
VLDFPRRFLADLARHDLVDNASMTLQHGVVCGGVDFGTLARRVKTQTRTTAPAATTATPTTNTPTTTTNMHNTTDSNMHCISSTNCF